MGLGDGGVGIGSGVQARVIVMNWVRSLPLTVSALTYIFFVIFTKLEDFVA